MSAESRKQKRETRKLQRKDRKVAFYKFIEAVQNALTLELKSEMTYKEKFKVIWPILKPTLEFVVLIKITGEKFDAVVNKVILIGNNMAVKEISDEEAMEFFKKVESIWDTVEMIFNLVKIFVPDKIDVIIDKVIEIGEWMFEVPKVS